MELGERGVVQGLLFDTRPPESDLRRERLMGVLDKANIKWGRGTMGIGSAGVKEQQGWAMLRENLSPAYTARWAASRRVVLRGGGGVRRGFRRLNSEHHNRKGSQATLSTISRISAMCCSKCF